MFDLFVHVTLWIALVAVIFSAGMFGLLVLRLSPLGSRRYWRLVWQGIDMNLNLWRAMRFAWRMFKD